MGRTNKSSKETPRSRIFGTNNVTDQVSGPIGLYSNGSKGFQEDPLLVSAREIETRENMSYCCSTRSLQESATAQLALRVVQQVESLIPMTDKDPDAVLSSAISTVSRIIPTSVVPADVLGSIVKQICALSPEVGLLIGAILSNQIESIDFFDGQNLLSVPSPTSSLCVTQLQVGLKTLDLSSVFIIEDGIFGTLASSPVCQTLRSLKLASSHITDASAPLWAQFSQLTELNIAQSKFITPTVTLSTIASCLMELQSFTTSTGCAELGDILNVCLSRSALPSLSKFVVAGPDVATVAIVTHLVKLLAQRPNPELFEEIYVGTHVSFQVKSDLIVKLHTLCPNLRRSLRPTQLTASHARELIPRQLLQNITLLSFFHDSDLQPADLELIALNCPFLEDLLIHNPVDAAQYLHLDKFLKLTRLLIVCSCIPRHDSWPPNLRDLSLSMRPNRFHSPEAARLQELAIEDQGLVDGLFQSLCQRFPTMKRLMIYSDYLKFVRAHVDLVVTSMPELEHLNIIMGSIIPGDDVNPQPLRICHQNMKSIPSIQIEGFYVFPLWLPRVDEIRQWGTSDPTVATQLWEAAIAPQHLPGITTIVGPRADSVDHLRKYKLLNSIFAFSKTLRSLSLDHMTAEQTAQLPQLNRLLSLSLHNCQLTSDIAFKVLKSMPLLTKLAIVDCLGIIGTDWIRHPRLACFTLKHTPIGRTQHGKLEDFILDANRLPMALDLAFTAECGSEINSLTIQYLPHLEKLSISTKMEMDDSSIALSVQGCPYLADLLVENVRIRSLHLHEVAHLLQLSIVSCAWPLYVRSDDPRFQWDTPSLKTLIIEASEAFDEPLQIIHDQIVCKLPRGQLKTDNLCIFPAKQFI